MPLVLTAGCFKVNKNITAGSPGEDGSCVSEACSVYLCVFVGVCLRVTRREGGNPLLWGGGSSSNCPSRCLCAGELN